MNICFIIPPQPELHKPSAYISLGVGYLAAVLEKSKHNVQVYDMNIEGGAFPPADVYGVTCVSATFPAVREIIRNLSKEGQTVIVGGVHPSIQPEDFVGLHCRVLIGEAEDVITKVIVAENIPRVIDGGLIEDIDKLPFPARHLFKNVVDYTGIHGQDIWEGATSIISSRGCPFQCTYCTRIPQTRKMRFRSPDYIVNELREIMLEYRINHFRFVDDIFTLNRDRIISLCEKVINEKLNINWMCITRGDTVDETMLSQMKKAGCVEIDIGVESGSQRILDLMNKRATVESLGNAIQMIKCAGIKAKTYLMYGFPGETDTDRQLTLDFIRKNKPDGVTISKFAPIPGSKLWDHSPLTAKQWFYQDYDTAYQEFRKKVHEVGGEIRQ